jgi:O-antigen/teichoic acid export membrane protein
MLLWPLLPSLRGAERLRERVPVRYYKRLIWSTLPVGLMGYAGQLSGQLETFILDLAGTRTDVGAYNVATSPLVGLIFVPVAISVGLAPLVTQLYRGARRDISMELMMSIATRAVLAVGLCVAVATNVFAGPIMRLFPAEYAGDAYILRIYTVITTLVFVVIANDQFLLAAGSRRQVATGALLNLGLAIALEVPLVATFGIRGIMAAKIAALVATIGYQLSAFRRDMRAGALHGILKMLGPIALFGVGLMLAWSWPVALQAAVLLPAVGASLLLFGALKRSELAQLRGLRLS